MSTPATASTLTTLTASVPEDLLERARERARADDRSTSAVVRIALTQYLGDDDEQSR